MAGGVVDQPESVTRCVMRWETALGHCQLTHNASSSPSAISLMNLPFAVVVWGWWAEDCSIKEMFLVGDCRQLQADLPSGTGRPAPPTLYFDIPVKRA